MIKYHRPQTQWLKITIYSSLSKRPQLVSARSLSGDYRQVLAEAVAGGVGCSLHSHLALERGWEGALGVVAVSFPRLLLTVTLCFLKAWWCHGVQHYTVTCFWSRNPKVGEPKLQGCSSLSLV